MDNIKYKYDEFLKLPFPEDLRIGKCIGNKGHLTQSDFKILKKCFTDLKTVVKELKGNNKTYFGLLLNIVHQTVEYLKINNKLINKEKKQLIQEWKTNFDRIRKILNDWDPIGVADVVDDEYDSINYLVYSALRSKGTIEDIKKAIKEYMNDSMEIDVPDSDLTEIAQKIKMIYEV